MPAPLQLVVGLGNPGAEYSETRHNAGFWFCDRLAQEHGARLAHETRFHGLSAKIPAHNLRLLLPQTFMNQSGRSVRALAAYFHIEAPQMLVVHDELDLPPGQLRLKFGGGLGGHNGLKDIVAQLGGGDFWRLRIGIGHPGPGADVVNHVLKPPRKEEAEAIDAAIDRALLAWPLLLQGDFDAATRRINARGDHKKETP